MEGLIPEGAVQFRHRARTVEQVGDKVCIQFQDGTVQMFDAVIGHYPANRPRADYP